MFDVSIYFSFMIFFLTYIAIVIPHFLKYIYHAHLKILVQF